MARSPQAGDPIGEAEARLQAAAAQTFPSQYGPDASRDAATLSAEPWRMLIDAHVGNLHSHNSIIKEMHRLACLGLPGAVLLFQDLDAVRSRAESMLGDALKVRNAVDEYLGAPASASHVSEASTTAQPMAQDSRNEAAQAAPVDNSLNLNRPPHQPEPVPNPDGIKHEPSHSISDVHQGGEAGSRVYLGNCPSQATVDDFKEFFTGYETQAINVPVNPRTLRPLGYAFVTLPNAVEAWRAFAELNGKPLLERKISVQIARTDPNGAPLARQTRPRSFSPGASESFLNSGRVTPAPPASGIYTLEQPPLYVPQVHDISATVCVRNLPVPTQSTDTDTDTLFALRGYLVRNIDTYVSFRTAEPYYYAFVTLRDAAEAQRAVAQFNNREWGGSSIVVEPADVRTWPRFNGPGPHNDGIEPAPPPAVEYDDITAEVNARLAATQQRKREARARKRERKRKRMSADSVISNPATDNGDYQFVPPLRKRPRQFWGGSTPVYPQDEEHGRLSPVDSYTPHRAAKRELDDDGYGALRSESPAAKRIKVEPV